MGQSGQSGSKIIQNCMSFMDDPLLKMTSVSEKCHKSFIFEVKNSNFVSCKVTKLEKIKFPLNNNTMFTIKQEHIFNSTNCSLFSLVETTATTKFNKTMTTFFSCSQSQVLLKKWNGII